MRIPNLLINKKTKGLSGNAFKAYYALLSEAKDNKIENFTILGLSKKWVEDTELNMVSGKNTVKAVIRELENLGLIENDQENRTLYFKE
jgi:predicted DNA-binding ArsR family transcriptional regulator